MSPNIGDFDANQVDPARAFDPMPPAWYAMQIVDSEVRQARTGTGQYLYLELELLEQYHPDYKGRKAFARLNLWNQNQQAVEIAQRELSAICRACGQMVINDSEKLHHTPIAVKLKVREATATYDASNEVSGYDALAARFGGGGPAVAVAPQAAPPAAGPTQAIPGGLPATGPPTAHPVATPPASAAPPWAAKG